MGRPTGLGDLWGWEEQDPVGMPYKIRALWVSALQAVLANEVLRMEAILAIINPWDIPDPGRKRPSMGRPTGVGDLWGWEEQDPVGMPYKIGAPWGCGPTSGWPTRS